MSNECCPDCGGEMEEIARIAIMFDDSGGYLAKCFTPGCEWEFAHPDDIDAARIEANDHIKDHL